MEIRKEAFIKLHAAVFLWGFTGVLGRLISLSEGWLVWWRLFITTIVLWLFLWLQPKARRKVSKENFLKISGIGTLLSIHWLLFYGSIKYSNVSIALTCLSTGGLLSAFIEPLFFRKKIDIIELLLGVVVACGIAFIYASNLQFSIGIYIGLLATFFSVLVSILTKKVLMHESQQTVMIYQLTGGFLGLSLLMPLYIALFPHYAWFPNRLDWLWLTILSIGCTILTYILYLFALRYLSAFTANLTLTLEPVYGILLAFLIYKENKYFSFTFYAGFALILLAVLVQMRRVALRKDR